MTNSTCLVGLERIGRLDILPQVFPVIFTPPAVQMEVGITADWLTVQAVQDSTAIAVLRTQVDIGEAEAIALALELEEVVIILDDRKARRLAEQLGLRVTGTIGMLLRAKHQGVVTEVKPLVMALEQVGFRLTEALIKGVLRLAGEL